MKREIIKTADGSSTIYLPEWNEHYHSKHGALQEARHVFIKMGLDHWLEKSGSTSVSILEIGFGTGLNALISMLEARQRKLTLEYTGVEAYPVSHEEVAALNYVTAFSQKEASEFFELLHQARWNARERLTDFFSLEKQQKFFNEIDALAAYDLIYFDAFGPRVQPELWSEEIFRSMFSALKENGVLVTYSAKGSVRRAMQAVGFQVERLPGPPGKREMLRATRS